MAAASWRSEVSGSERVDASVVGPFDLWPRSAARRQSSRSDAYGNQQRKELSSTWTWDFLKSKNC